MMKPTTLSVAEARRVAIRAQALDGSAGTIIDVVRRIGSLQLDPTSRVAPSHLLVLWSRLGPFDLAELDRLLWRDRSLFEWNASVYTTEDFPFVKARMRRFPGNAGAWQRRVGAWLRANESFRRYVLQQLRRRGPLRSNELEDRAVKPWQSTGWTHERNVTQMLHFLGAQGKVLVARREGRQRVWDLAERVLPPELMRIPPASEQAQAERQLRTLGLARLAVLRHRVGEAVLVDGVAGEWLADSKALDRVNEPLAPRMTFLSPFDRLIYDRARTEELFGFRYRLQIYVPRGDRKEGYFVLPILHGENLVGRLDPEYDRRNRILRVNAIRAEPGARLPLAAVRRVLRRLAEFLGAEGLELP
jgi:uncharacterized protein YcaQ